MQGCVISCGTVVFFQTSRNLSWSLLTSNNFYIADSHCKRFLCKVVLKFFFIIFSSLLLYVICDFDNISMENSFMYSLKKKSWQSPKIKKRPISQSLVVLGQNPLDCEGHLGPKHALLVRIPENRYFCFCPP